MDYGEILLFTTGYFEPGGAEVYCASVSGEESRAIAEAELMYYRGNARAAMNQLAALEDSSDLVVMISATLCRAVASICGGGVSDAIKTYRLFNDFCSGLGENSKLKYPLELVLLYFNMILHNVDAIKFPPFGVNAFDVPERLKPMAFYAYTHYLAELGDVSRALGMAEGSLVLMKKPQPVGQIYLSLIIARCYMERRQWDRAEHYFRYAWELAKPDGLVMPFAEYRGMLSGLLERCLRYEEPAAYKQILELSGRYHRNWVFVHNELTGDRISDELTAIEYNVAALAAKGLSNAEISDFLGIKINSTRAHLRNIFNKLDIDSRKELSKYVI